MTKYAIVLASFLPGASLASAAAQGPDTTFPLLSGKSAPLTLQLKDLDSSWRVFEASSNAYENLLASAMGGGSNHIFTKGDTVTVGTDVFLVTYKADGPDMTSLFAGQGAPKTKPMTAATTLRLSLLNLHALSAMDGIRVFDLKEQIAASQKSPFPPGMFRSQSTTATPDDVTADAKGQNDQPSADAVAEPALLRNGSLAPDFVVHDDKGAPVRLSAYRGKVVVLDFWATWCVPCQESLPGTNATAAKFDRNKVVVLGVNVWDTKKAFHHWLPEHKSFSSIKFAIDTHAQQQDVATKLYHVSGIPTQYIIDRHGRIVKSIVGASTDESELSAGIRRALSR